jgi:hypothetical protein
LLSIRNSTHEDCTDDASNAHHWSTSRAAHATVSDSQVTQRQDPLLANMLTCEARGPLAVHVSQLVGCVNPPGTAPPSTVGMGGGQVTDQLSGTTPV